MQEEFLALVSELRKKYGEPLYALSLGDTLYIFRPLVGPEYNALRNAGLTSPEDICRASVVWPEQIDWDHTPAADVDHLHRQALNLSGFGDPEISRSIHNAFRAEMQTFQGQAEAIICRAFPNIRLEEVRSWPAETFLLYLSRAEWMVKNFDGFSELNIELQTEPEQEMTPELKRQQAQELREQGIDPMIALVRPRNRTANWLNGPLIVGTKRWREEITWQASGTSEPFARQK